MLKFFLSIDFFLKKSQRTFQNKKASQPFYRSGYCQWVKNFIFNNMHGFQNKKAKNEKSEKLLILSVKLKSYT